MLEKKKEKEEERKKERKNIIVVYLKSFSSLPFLIIPMRTIKKYEKPIETELRFSLFYTYTVQVLSAIVCYTTDRA